MSALRRSEATTSGAPARPSSRCTTKSRPRCWKLFSWLWRSNASARHRGSSATLMIRAMQRPWSTLSRPFPCRTYQTSPRGSACIGGPGARVGCSARADAGSRRPSRRLRARRSILQPRRRCRDDLCGAPATPRRRGPREQPTPSALRRGHVCAFNKRSAVWRSAQVLERHEGLRTRALRSMRAALTALNRRSAEDECLRTRASVLERPTACLLRVSRLLRRRARVRSIWWVCRPGIQSEGGRMAAGDRLGICAPRSHSSF